MQFDHIGGVHISVVLIQYLYLSSPSQKQISLSRKYTIQKKQSGYINVPVVYLFGAYLWPDFFYLNNKYVFSRNTKYKT